MQDRPDHSLMGYAFAHGFGFQSHQIMLRNAQGDFLAHRIDRCARQGLNFSFLRVGVTRLTKTAASYSNASMICFSSSSRFVPILGFLAILGPTQIFMRP